jgi:adenylosuccinate lyase
MPHKRNQISLEQVCGLSRLLRGYALAGLEDVALWHERDISHSSVERVVLPDSTMALAHMLRSLIRVVGGLEVDREAMLAELERRGGLARSQQILLALLGRGMAREKAYRLVQSLAREADRPGGDFRASCLASAELTAIISPTELDEALSLDRYLGGVDESFRRLGLLDDLPATSAER